MTIEILNFTEALRLTDTGKRIIKAKRYDKIPYISVLFFDPLVNEFGFAGKFVKNERPTH